MLDTLLAKVVGTQNDRELKRLRPIVAEVNGLEPMIQAHATCLCLTAGKTLIFDRDETIKLANKNKIAIVAR